MTDDDRRILKYHVPIGGEHTIELSIFGDIVHVDRADDDHEVSFWAMNYPPSTVRQWYTFRVFGTLDAVPLGWKHMGTVVSRFGGALHLFVQGVDCRRLP